MGARVWLTGTAVLLALFCVQPAFAQDRSERLQIPFATERGATLYLEGLVRLPEGDGPFPLAILNHGTGAKAKSQKPEDLEFLANWFLARGWAAAMPMRRSFGKSGGMYEEAYSCANPDYLKSGRQAARDIKASVDFLRKLPGIDGSRIVLVGQSSGGWAVVAASAEAIEGLKGVISFAGGRGGKPGGGRLCPHDENLVEAGRRFGQTAHVPSLWIYAANDNLTPISLMREVYQAYAQGAKESHLQYYESKGAGGHFVIRHPEYWTDEVEDFLFQMAR